MAELKEQGLHLEVGRDWFPGMTYRNTDKKQWRFDNEDHREYWQEQWEASYDAMNYFFDGLKLRENHEDEFLYAIRNNIDIDLAYADSLLFNYHL
jgi:hypothetical protein